jgi:pimeloyl-ACP methyl ester carboxylesterase
MPTVRVNGAELYYEDTGGSGSPIVFVHGVWMSSRCFRPQLEGLADRFRVVALDLRGHGGSEHVTTGHTVAQYARDLRAFLEGLELDRPVVVGWSMGALVSWDYVRQFGAVGWRGLVVVDQTPSDYAWPDWPYGVFDLEAVRHTMTACQTDRPAFVEEFIPLLFKAEPPAAEHAGLIREETLRLPDTIASAIILDQTLQDYRDVLPQVTVPALVITGRDEKLVPIAAEEWVTEQMPNARLVVLEESGHSPFIEEPEAFNATLADWIESLP